MALLDAIALLAPQMATRWLNSRAEFRAAQRRFEAAAPDKYRPNRTSAGDGNAVVAAAGSRLRGQARHLDENHDLVVSVLDDLVNNTVGNSVGVDPLVRMKDRTLADEVNNQLRDLFEEWSEAPETTGQYDLAGCRRLGSRTMFRDGEYFTQLIRSDAFRYPTRVPFVIDLMEPDYCPFDYTLGDNVVQGIELNGWGAPVNFFFWKNHPGALGGMQSANSTTLIKKNARAVLHPKLTKRIKQVRGVSQLHAVIQRLRDIKDYEESERIAAKAAADITGWFKGTAPNSAAPTSANPRRELSLQAGTMLQLQGDESVGLLSADRPNTGLEAFRNAMLRAVAGGTGTRYSPISRNYNGTYSSQRQELVEGAVAYRGLFGLHVASWERPIWNHFVEICYLSGLLKLGPGVDLATLYRADFRAPAIPWIDPKKEADAWATLVQNDLESRTGIQRMRGRDADKVFDEIEAEKVRGFGIAPAPAPIPGQREPADDPENELKAEAA